MEAVLSKKSSIFQLIEKNNKMVYGILVKILRELHHDFKELSNSDTIYSLIDKYATIHYNLANLSSTLDFFNYKKEAINSEPNMTICYIGHLIEMISDIQKLLECIEYEKTAHHRCIVCKIDMGPSNPRQYCCKTYCPEEKTKKK